MQSQPQKGIWLFLREAFRHPSKIGAVLPSSRSLAKKMAALVGTSQNLRVLELGPGTGVVTEALLEAGVPETNLMVLENAHELALHLRRQFPRLRVIEGDALKLKALLEHEVPIDVVVSSLPLRNFSEEEFGLLKNEIAKILNKNGTMIQYTYGLWNPRFPTMQNLFKKTASHYVWNNIPPARIDVFEKL